MVKINNLTASDFFPSKYQRIGRPITSELVKPAEKTKSINMNIGRSIELLASILEPSTFDINSTIRTIYKNVPREFNEAYFIISLFSMKECFI